MRETQLGSKGSKRWRSQRPEPRVQAPAYNELKASWQGVVGLMLRRQLRDLALPLATPVRLGFAFHERDRHRDPDGVSAGARKIILDALVDVGVIPTDGAAHVGGFEAEDFFYPGDPQWEGVLIAVRLFQPVSPSVRLRLPVRLPDWNELREAVEVGVRRMVRRKGAAS